MPVSLLVIHVSCVCIIVLCIILPNQLIWPRSKVIILIYSFYFSDDPSERKRSLDSRSATIDPVERFRSQYIERGNLTDTDLQKAAMQAQQEYEMGFFTGEQHSAIMRQLMQVTIQFSFIVISLVS